MVMPKSYDLLVEKLMHKVTQMTPEETAQEIAQVTGGIIQTESLPETNHPAAQRFDEAFKKITEVYTTKSGRVMKSKPGRKKGWRKETK